MANYVDNKEFFKELIKSKEQDKLTDRTIEIFQLMIKRIVRPPLLSYQTKIDEDECKSVAMFNVIKYWRNFNPEHPNANPFAFFTQVIKTGSTKGLNGLKLFKNKSIKSVSINEIDGIYNI